MKNIRAFFAIVLPKELHQPLTNILQTLNHSIPEKHIRLVKLEHVHCTLQFMKDVQAEHMPALIQQAREQLRNAPSFVLQLDKLEWFPSIEHPKIVSLSLGPDKVLQALSGQLGRLIHSLGYAIEKRPFRPHVTLGRIANFDPHKLQLAKIKLPEMPPVAINKLYLIESKPDNGVTHYKPVAEFHLMDPV